MAEHTIEELHQKQALPLSAKIEMSKDRIAEWVNHFGEDNVYVSFSGGKDSTVLLDIARKMYPNMKAVFVDTGLEYPETVQFVKSFDNVDIIKPKMTFKQVVREYGYPMFSKEVADSVYYARKYMKTMQDRIDGKSDGTEKLIGAAGIADLIGVERRKSHDDHNNIGGISYNDLITGDKDIVDGLLKLLDVNRNDTGNVGIYTKERYKFMLDADFEIGNRCCYIMKKSPTAEYGKLTGKAKITGQMASESRVRTQRWLDFGCNSFNSRKPSSKPLSFWTTQDVLMYIKIFNIPMSPIYGDIVSEGNAELPDNAIDLELFDRSLPCLDTTGFRQTGCMWCLFGIQLEKSPNRLERMKETHPKIYDYIMKPESDGGLGYKDKIDWINEYGNMNIKY